MCDLWRLIVRWNKQNKTRVPWQQHTVAWEPCGSELTDGASLGPRAAAAMPDWLGVCVLLSLLLSVLTAAACVLYSGLLSDITVLTGSAPIKKITFAYKFTEGPYRACGPLLIESHRIGPKLSSIGVFYDDPKTVNTQYTAALIGNLLSPAFCLNRNFTQLFNFKKMNKEKSDRAYHVKYLAARWRWCHSVQTS